MTPNAQLAVRLVVLGVVATVVQLAAISQFTVLGSSPDVMPLMVMAVGLLAGSLPGALMGFGVGLFLDMALLQPPGVSSLIYLTVGYFAGRLRELRDPAHGLVPLAAGVAATAFVEVGFGLLQFLLGISEAVSLLLLRQIFVTIALGAMLALPVHAIVRRIVLRFLPEDPRRRRRRAYTTGGLSPLSRA